MNATHSKETPIGVIDPEDLPLKWGEYWLHPDGWYRLFPPNPTKNLPRHQTGEAPTQPMKSPIPG